MTDYIEPTEKRTVPDHAGTVGIDSEGRTHYYPAAKARDERVFVQEDDVVLVFDLAGTDRDLDDWVGHVDWSECYYDEGIVGQLERGLEAGA
ncbi:hypothetical protein ACFQL1_01635 [Halomicroarcula sp. GCM10025709]|uniref:hypothetical protein n=1 Tax=Haloarcula TaxID=2237 RepID=UPI0024C4446D|nr:hypothetical protein [Halomicroarcula sp. YJ-61-S]